jgi:RND family efflux transporter MFP subunit
LLASLKPAEISAQVQQVKLGLQKAERDYQRATNLYNDSVATLEQLQNAKTALDVAKQAYDQASFNQTYSRIYAPADGFVVKKLANTGEVISTGTAVLIMNALSSNSKWVLKTGVSDREWALLEKGNKASVSFDALPGKQFSAVVSRKAMASDPVSGVFEVELQVNINESKAAAGMFGRAIVQPSDSVKGFTIPFEALIEANGKSGFVFVTNDQKTVKRVPVTIGSINESSVLVTTGLEDAKFLITSGSPFLNERSTIVVKN